MKKILLILLPLALLLLHSCNPQNPVLTIEGGQIIGVPTSTEGVVVYKGIPYAAAPIGDLRWQEPQAVTPWEGVIVADKFGNAAYQAAHNEGEFYQKEFFFDGDAPYSEDCLSLNIWTPAPGQTDEKLPVAMWVHGGAYMAGWGFEPEMDGEAWAKRGVILVTINYRLGVFGFLAHPELSAESEHGVSGNYGMLDQIAALKWISRNISQFGGDPENIMIFGQSAGAFSIQTLVTSPLSKDIPSAAIIQSGGGISGQPMLGGFSLSDAELLGKAIMDTSGFTSLEAMRNATTEEIFASVTKYAQSAHQYVMLRPVIDGYALTESFNDAALGGRISDIPYMIGCTADDMGALGSTESIERFCLSRKDGRAYAYKFNRPLPGDDAGAFHSSELWYIFNTLKRSWRPFTPADYQLSEVMTDCWTNFAKFGNPNPEGDSIWSPIKQSGDPFMVFDIK